jgi:formate hydrogenlyase subunit 4
VEDVFMKYLFLFISPVAALVLSPLFMGIINRTKALFAGRKGPPLLQVYYDLARLLQKGSVYSTTTSWIFRFSPPLIFFLTVVSTLFVPVISKGVPALSFTGDLVLFLYLLALARVFLILSALDTGSAFEGMGASREAFFSALAEPVIFVCLISIMRVTGADSISAALSAQGIFSSVTVLLTVIPLFIVLLVENSRIPFDDPMTHLELTMVHEVMILDNSGPGLALLEYAASVKIWLLSMILARILIPFPAGPVVVQCLQIGVLMGIIACAIGVTEAVMARVRLIKIPRILFGAGVIALLGFFINVTGIPTW